MSISAAKREAIARYDAKTFKKINIALRIEEDAKLIEAFQEAQQKGIRSREWLIDLFERSRGEFDVDELISQVESLKKTSWENSSDKYYAGATLAYDNVLQIIKELNADR